MNKRRKWKILALSKISHKHLATIPKEVMSRLDLKEGDKIIWEIVECPLEEGGSLETFISVSKA